MQYPKSVQRLIAEFAKLPGVGRKSAERFALHLLKAGRRDAASLGRAASDLHGGVRTCAVCGTIDETDLMHLGRIESLQTLSFHHNEMTDRGIEHLANLRRLEKLEFIQTRVTEEAVDKLRQELPNCEIRVLRHE